MPLLVKSSLNVMYDVPGLQVQLKMWQAENQRRKGINATFKCRLKIWSNISYTLSMGLNTQTYSPFSFLASDPFHFQRSDFWLVIVQ
jgi:hypothetical protein